MLLALLPVLSILAVVGFGFFVLHSQRALHAKLEALQSQRETQLEAHRELRHDLANYQHRLDDLHLKQMVTLQESVQRSMQDVREQIAVTLRTNAENMGVHFTKLSSETDQRLKEISQQVERRLSEGFEKTTATFTDVIKRLALIDKAQEKIAELSSSVISLQEILSDKRSRGAFGEVQLSALIRNLIPETHFSLQHTLSNGKRVDCLLFLPEPSGNITIDAKFPLESYQKLINVSLSEVERRLIEQQFRQDLKKHILDISSKYIISGETADGAMMFIPAEAIFAEIHAHYPDIIEEAHQARVWLASPTTLMAILTTARAVIKDEATRQQVHIIREHLGYLAKDFNRFEERMNNLARHIEQANTDVKQVQTSAQKITSRFTKIERVELSEMERLKLAVEDEVLEEN